MTGEVRAGRRGARQESCGADPARRRPRAGDIPERDLLKFHRVDYSVEPSGVAIGKASTMDLRKLSRGLAICIALLGLGACAIYQPAPGPLPYSYAPRPVYSSPFLGFGFGFL